MGWSKHDFKIIFGTQLFYDDMNEGLILNKTKAQEAKIWLEDNEVVKYTVKGLEAKIFNGKYTFTKPLKRFSVWENDYYVIYTQKNQKFSGTLRELVEMKALREVDETH